MKLLTWLVRAALVLAALGCCFPSKESSTSPAPRAAEPTVEAEQKPPPPPAMQAVNGDDEAPHKDEIERLKLPEASPEATIEMLSLENMIGAVVTKPKTLPKCLEKGGWQTSKMSSGEAFWACDKLNAKTSDFTNVEFYTDKDNRVVALIGVSSSKEWSSNYMKAQGEGCKDMPDIKSISCDKFVAMNFPVEQGSALMFMFASHAGDVLKTSLDDEIWSRGPEFKKSIQLGDFSYKIISARKTQKIGDQYMGAKATPGGTFAVIKYRIENTANETKTVLSDDFELHDYKGRIFRPSANALTALAVESDGELILRELQPGLAVERSTAFEIPLDSIERPRKLKVVVPEKGLMGTEKVEIEVWFP